jgi:GxxExxY protein
MESTPGKVETPQDDVTFKIIGVAMAVHNELGPGFPEEIYHRAMRVGLQAERIGHESEYQIDLKFRDTAIGHFKLDFVVERTVIVERAQGSRGPGSHSQTAAHRLPGCLGPARRPAHQLWRRPPRPAARLPAQSCPGQPRLPVPQSRPLFRLNTRALPITTTLSARLKRRLVPTTTVRSIRVIR